MAGGRRRWQEVAGGRGWMRSGFLTGKAERVWTVDMEPCQEDPADLCYTEKLNMVVLNLSSTQHAAVTTDNHVRRHFLQRQSVD